MMLLLAGIQHIKCWQGHYTCEKQFCNPAIVQGGHYTAEDEDLQMFALTKTEWDQAAVVCTILLPFKMASQRLQATKRPGIDSVFWDYESLFNKIDAIKSTFTRPQYREKEWIQELHAGVEELS